MESVVARGIAHRSHVNQRDRFGEPLAEHVERVAAAVAAADQTVAYLHDVLEKSDTPVGELVENGLTNDELTALRLLTRKPGETFEEHALRIAHARGPAAAVARRVRVADLDDHLGHSAMPYGAPPYRWARAHIVGARAA